MKIHVQLEYTATNGDPIESLFGIEHTDIGMMHEMFNEFLTALHYDHNAKFSVGGECKCH